MAFFTWYFGRGFRLFLLHFNIWLQFLWRFFHIKRLSATLIAPWHKDVTFKSHRGFHPKYLLERLASNIFARVMGMIVRILTIFTGLCTIIIFVTFFIISAIIWYTLPIYTIGIALLMMQGWIIIGIVALSIPIVLYYGVLRVYMHDRYNKDYRAMSMSNLHNEPWFERVYYRVGIARGDMTRDILSNFDEFEKILAMKDISVKEFENILAWEISQQEEKEYKKQWWREEYLATIRPIGQFWSYGYTVHLDRYSTDLSRHDFSQYEYSFVVGHEKELSMLRLTLERPAENNALLIGDAGVGKKTLIHHLAKQLRQGKFDDNLVLKNKRILIVDMAEALAAANSSSDNVDLFLHKIFHEAAYVGNVIIVIENFHRYIKNDKMSYDIMPIIADYLHLPTFQIIALTSRKAYNRDLDQRDDILKSFTTIEITELEEKETQKVLFGRFVREEKSDVLFTFAALRDIVRLSGRYRADAPLPERAIDLATEVIIYWKDSTDHTSRITQNLVQEFLTKKTGMPMGFIDENEKDKLLNMESLLHERIIGQNEAVNQIADAVRLMRSGMSDEGKPMSSFLFLGPTGVGKTETAKALSEIYYGSEKAMIRIDMSEFQGQDAFHLMIGDERTGDPGRLVTAAKEHPYSLLLLDELEKAHPRVLDLFLQILDEGYVTDAFGERINFRNMIIIATSNAGAVLLRDAIKEGKDTENMKQELIDKVVSDGVYRLEFLNRFSDVILFQSLAEDDLVDVIKLMFGRIVHRMKKEKNMTLTIEEALIPIIIKNGYNPIFGARSVARYIDDTINNVIAQKIIRGDVARGGTLSIGVKDVTSELI